MNRGDPLIVESRPIDLTRFPKEKRMTTEEIEKLEMNHHANPANASVKPAYKTTEFWLSLVAVIVGMLLASGVLSPDDPAQAKALQILGMISSLLASLGYTAARTSAKNRAVDGATAIAIAKASAPIAATVFLDSVSASGGKGGGGGGVVGVVPTKPAADS